VSEKAKLQWRVSSVIFCHHLYGVIAAATTEGSMPGGRSDAGDWIGLSSRSSSASAAAPLRVVVT
jgi:hypothetical protein